MHVQHSLVIYLAVIENQTMANRSEAAIRDAENRRARLRQWIDEKFSGSQAAFVSTHKLNQGEVSALLKDKSFGSVKARNLEAQTGMPERYLEWREAVDQSPEPVAPPFYEGEPADGYTRLPILAEAAAGNGKYPLQEAVQHIDVLESYIHQRLNTNPRNLKILTARGGSMTGVIEDGDIMFVQPTNEFTDDGIYILTLDDLIRVKRLSVSITSGNVLIESNDGRKAEELPLKEVPHRLHIQGRVLGSWSLKSFS